MSWGICGKKEELELPDWICEGYTNTRLRVRTLLAVVEIEEEMRSMYLPPFEP
jgi:hypothetical protein